MKTKSFACRIKAAGGDQGSSLAEGEFEAIVSVFGNRDLYGDVVMPNAFDRTLGEWAAKGDPIPVIWSHQWANPDAHIGVVKDAEPRKTGDLPGLWIKGALDLQDEPFAQKVNRLLKGRRVTQFSFAFDVVDGGPAVHEGEDVWELRDLDLFEVGPCLLGVNPETELLAAKSPLATFERIIAEVKAGRVLSAANENALVSALDAIRNGITSIEEVLAKVTNDEGKAKPHPAAKPETREGKGEEQPGTGPVDASRLLADLCDLEAAL